MCHLETVRQYDNEALSNYMKHFQEAINKISNLDEREALTYSGGTWTRNKMKDMLSS